MAKEYPPLKSVPGFSWFGINLGIKDETPDLRLWVNKQQADSFADQAMHVCAAGRPLCNLCGAPVDPPEEGGHRCPRRNGNHTADEIQKI